MVNSMFHIACARLSLVGVTRRVRVPLKRNFTRADQHSLRSRQRMWTYIVLVICHVGYSCDARRQRKDVSFFGGDSTRYRAALIKEYWERSQAGRKVMER